MEKPFDASGPRVWTRALGSSAPSDPPASFDRRLLHHEMSLTPPEGAFDDASLMPSETEERHLEAAPCTQQERTKGKAILATRSSYLALTCLLAVTGACVGNRGPSFTIGGHINGLTTSGLVLQINGQESLAVPANAAEFQFTRAYVQGASYTVIVLTQPTDLVCAVSGGQGSVSGRDIRSIVVTCTPAAPSNLTYSTNPAVYATGVAITPNTPSSDGGGVISYSISPTLPAGLSLDPSTGVISGTPVADAVTTSYTITASNSEGSTTATVILTCILQDPSNLVYSANPAVYAIGVPITPNTPSGDGGRVASYRVEPALPAGLSLDPATGVISGTPLALAATASYAVTATNSGGSATASLSIAVKTVVVTGIAAGDSHACAIVNGGARCWGYNDSAQLGHSTNGGSSRVPVQVTNLTTGVQAIYAGQGHTCAIVNGGAWCWGFNGLGNLGDGSETELSWEPVQAHGLTSGVQALALGSFHTCAIVNGGVECWGSNGAGQLGLDPATTARSRVPVQVPGLESGVRAIAAGYQHTCVIKDEVGYYGVRCWGANGYGQLGNDSTAPSFAPVRVLNLYGDPQAIGAGLYHACAIVSGDVRCWGNNDGGQLGNPRAGAEYHVAFEVSGLRDGGQAIDGGRYHTCAIVNGGVQCWGTNYQGQLGDGSQNASQVPAPVPDLVGVQGVATGNSFSCAIVRDGVQCWGDNYNGQLGDGTASEQSYVPVQVSGLPGDP